ncbi:MAG: ATP-binding protein, partial [Candidatus Binatia bacterium]
ELSALLLIAETATQSLDTDRILNETQDKSLEILRLDLGYIRILEPQTRNLVVRVARGLYSPELLASSTPLGSSRRSHGDIIFETREPYVSSDIQKDPSFSRRTMQREGVVSAALVPIMSKQNILGVMAVGSRKFHRFPAKEIHLLKAFGSQLGAALENAQLYNEVVKGKAYIESLVENAADAIVSTDLDDRILNWNRGAELIFGYRKEEVTGQHLSILLPPERYHELDEMRAKVTISGALRDIEVRSKRKDGQLIYLALSVSPIGDGEGKITGFLRVAKDVSEKKRFERRLKELDRMKSDFVSNVSHELRTPLTAIKGSADNMLDGITGPLTDKQTRYLSRIKSNADRLTRLITDLLDLSKIESGKIDLRPAVLAVNSIFKEVAENLRPVGAEKLIALDVPLPDNDVQVWGDRDKVVQILMNLIGNALKFTPPHGKVGVGIEKLDREWVKLFVTDTGPGIPAEETGKIFEKFYQLKQSDKQKAKGTGLGLAISKALVEMHGGRIWIESGVERGCVFSFTLPARQPLEL